MEVEALLQELVGIPSESGDEAAIALFLEELLSGQGFDVELQEVEPGRNNLIATRGDPERILTTHMDTVPGQPERRETGQYIYGRGACDAKASIASMIVAAVETDADDCALVFDVGEETDFSGIGHLMERDWCPELVVVGEPTQMRRIVGQKGLLTLRLRAEGVPAHGSKPADGVNAIDTLYDAVEQLRSLRTQDEFFGRTAFNLAMIEGGEADNVVPPSAEATVQFRTVRDNEQVIEAVTGLDVDCSIVHDFSPRRFADVEGRIFPGFTEAFYWAEVADATLLQGPGSMEDAHAADEKVEKQQLKDAVTTYTSYLTDGLDTDG
jgi:acetylornithine deacetylase